MTTPTTNNDVPEPHYDEDDYDDEARFENIGGPSYYGHARDFGA